MQRRAAAIYVAFFLVVGAVSFSLIATASAPELSFENPEHELGQGDTFTVDGTEYTVASIDAEMSGGGGGGHGGGGGAALERSATLNATDESGNTTEVSVDDEANVTLGETTYFAHFPDNSTLVLTQEFDQYRAYQEQTVQQKKHTDGLWGVTLLSSLVAVFMVGLAFLPSRY
ncbi:hypothetical protein [Halorarum salinum]|uniref:Uncharacterized protein n=1 Tax=Halorarum salinum TaxID=2743089 RepID=A0A7D5L951_9EURY|nr:hypothetical protein [Halobaculum salinum]QLG60952.1 hypothetical protein HUG12_04055 [Halobaculum salinum]